MATQTENFNKANEDPFVSSNWDAFSSDKGEIVSNTWATDGANQGLVWKTSVTTFNADQYSQAAIQTAGLGNACPIVRGSAGSGNGYGALASATVMSIRRYDATAPTVLGSQGSLTILAGDIIKVTVSGSTITGYQNGVQRIQVTDSTYATGQPGLMAQTDNSSLSTFDDWEGGDLSASLDTTGSLVAGASVIAGTIGLSHPSTGALVSGPSVIAGTSVRSAEIVGTLNSQNSVLSGAIVFGALVTGALNAGASVIAGTIGKARAVGGGLVASPAVLSGSLVGQPNEGQVVVYDVSSEAEPTSPFVRRVRIIATTDCHIKVNDPDNVQPATDEDMFIAAYKKERLSIRPGQVITVIQDSAPGRLYITENR